MNWLFKFLTRPLSGTLDCTSGVLAQGCYWRLQRDLDVRFPVCRVSESKDRIVDHIQCQVKGATSAGHDTWEYSVMLRGIVTTGKREFAEFTPYKILTWQKLLEERLAAEKDRKRRGGIV